MTRRRMIVAAGMGSLLLLLGAWTFQALGYAPCKMCIWQRWPHGAAALIAGVGWFVPVAPLVLAGAAAALATSGIGAYHAGVELGWWPGPASCSGSADSLAGLSGTDLLSTGGAVDIVMCDQVVWSFLGVSMAGWNAILSLGLALVWIAALRVSAR
jgi:disulfide bond formation protein DsbB